MPGRCPPAGSGRRSSLRDDANTFPFSGEIFRWFRRFHEKQEESGKITGMIIRSPGGLQPAPARFSRGLTPNNRRAVNSGPDTHVLIVLMKKICAIVVTAMLSCSACTAKEPPNVLFIAIDDLNDWVGTLGGYPGVITPNLDRLGERGVFFTKAYCAAPACNPSRAALMTGVLPSTSGVYRNRNPWRRSQVLQDALTIPQYFMANGYKAMGSGKIFHGRYPDPASWQEYWPSQRKNSPVDPVPENRPVNGIPDTAHFDWGSLENPVTDMGDWQVADWVIDQLDKKHDRPFFLACGFFRPHLPWYVPQKYFDLYPLEAITLPEVNENDHDDIPKAGREMARREDHENVLKYKQWRKAVQGYLASITFADECVGRVIEALDNSAYRDNTIIVLWSDHGWHLGEKLHWRKFSLWEEATHNVLYFSGPGVAKGRSEYPVNLLDIYPTLIDLCKLPALSQVEGESLTPVLADPDAHPGRPALTTHGFQNHSLRSKRWRYIRYADGSQELYDHDNDELEWRNLAGDPQYQSVIADLSKWLPRVNANEIYREK